MDIPIKMQETRKDNYWCENIGQYVERCNDDNQCFECALMQSRIEEKHTETNNTSYDK